VFRASLYHLSFRLCHRREHHIRRIDRIVGVSGARTAPDVCIVAGASGAPAFLWGIEKAAFIAALDLDEHAPIVAAADAAIIADCVTVAEELARIASAGDRRA
jgi:electron transfer flavoprotein alpha subunit